MCKSFSCAKTLAGFCNDSPSNFAIACYQVVNKTALQHRRIH